MQVYNIFSGRTICSLDQAILIANSLNCEIELFPNDFIRIYQDGSDYWNVDRHINGVIENIESLDVSTYQRVDLKILFSKWVIPYLCLGLTIKMDSFNL